MLKFDFSLGYFLVGPSGKIFTLEKEKSEIQAELATIKSVQLELVRNSKLERKVIKIEKEIDGLKSAQKPKEQNFKYYTRIARVIYFLYIFYSLLLISIVFRLYFTSPLVFIYHRVLCY